MSGHRSFTDHLLDKAAESADRDALVLLRHGDAGDGVAAAGSGEVVTVSYAELDLRAKALAAVLQERGALGERVLIVQSSQQQFATSLIACLYAGAVAVPVPMPGGRFHHDERLAGIVKDTAAACAITDSTNAAAVSQLLARAGYGGVTCLAADAVSPSAPWQRPRLDADSVALLQYTSGSTRDPRGVVITHGNLNANQAAIQRALRTHAGSRFGGWLPLHHDMGLVGQLLHPLWLGATVVLLPAQSFVEEPARWLRMISEHQLNVSGGPDSAYDLCVQRVSDKQLATLDLGSWHTAVTGGEAVRPETVRAFIDRFTPAGFRPSALVACYGLAEATLLVSGAVTDAPPTLRDIDTAAAPVGAPAPRPGPAARTVVGCGPAADGELRIVDPDTRVSLPDGQVGEIWVRGDSVGRGYWKRRRETRTTFQAITAEGLGGFLRTGDLGFLAGGELFVTARIKDLIVVGGHNLYPEDMERAVRLGSEMFAANAVFGVPGEYERVVIVQEVSTAIRYDPDFPALGRVVQRCVEEEFDVAAGGVVLVRIGSVRRTTSGKVERAAMRRLFLDRKLKPLYQVVTPDVARLVAAETDLAAGSVPRGPEQRSRIVANHSPGA